MARKIILFIILWVLSTVSVQSQSFSSGPIPLCDTSYFTAYVSGVGQLYPPGGSSGGFSLNNIQINITTDHPQTLKITLTSPQGITLLLSAFNGAGGVNYTNTIFDRYGPTIAGAAAPFTGTWSPQGGSLGVFDWTYGDGTWTITVIDTACTSGSSGGWTAGYFDGAASGGMTFDPLSCYIIYPDVYLYICGSGSVDLSTYTYGQWGVVNTPGYYNWTNNWGGCWESGGVMVTQSVPPVLGNDINYQLCQGSTVNLNTLFPITGLNNQWDFNGTPISVTAASVASQPGVYTVIASSGTGCDDTASVTISNTAAAVIPNGSNQNLSVCSNESVNLNSLYNTAGLTSNWYFNNSIISNTMVNAPGSYSLIATNSGGCNDTAVVSLTTTPAPSLGNNQFAVTCTGSPFDLTALYNTSGYTPVWYYNTAVVTNPAAVLLTGTYELIVTDGNGCMDTADVTIAGGGSSVSLGSDITTAICSNTFLDLSLMYNTAGYTTAWYYNNALIGNSGLVNASGAYTLIASTSGGCADTADVNLTVNAVTLLGADQNVISCSNSTIDLTQLYNTTGITSAWTLNSTPVADPSNIAVPGNYTLITTDANNCVDTADVNVSIQPAPSLGSDQSVTLCEDDSLDLTTLFNTTGLTSSWTLNSQPVVNPTAVNSSGVYELIAVSTNSCSDTAIVNLAMLPLPVAGANQALSVCSNSYIDLTSVYNTTGLNTIWTINNVVISNPSSVNAAGVYTLQITDAAGCSNTADVNLTVNSPPSLGNDQSLTICDGTSADLTTLYPVAGLNAAWFESGNLVTDPAVVNTPGDYNLVVTASNMCSDTAVVSLDVLSPVSLGNDRNVELCDWMNLDLSTAYQLNGFSATYTFNGTPITDYTAVHDSGDYNIEVTDLNGCTASAQITVFHRDCLCEADFKTDAKCIQIPVNFQVLADSAIIDAHWLFGNPLFTEREGSLASVNFYNEDSVEVTLNASLSCGEVTIKKNVAVKDCACNIYFPQAFTPNGDGLNDMFQWYGNCDPEEFSMTIHNRYGELIYATADPDSHWDGTFENSLLPEGVYVLHVEYKLPNQKRDVVNSAIAIQR